MRLVLGANYLTAAMFFFSAGVVAILLTATVFAVFYHRYIYKLRRRRYDETLRPRCSIIIPCKGTPKDFKENLLTFTKLDYPSYEVIFAVESENDPAVAVINSVIESAPRCCSMVVAGLAKTCAQKNFNQLAAIKAAHNPEVYVFADADIGPGPNWLTELVIPLSDSSVTATTGFRWLMAEKSGLGGQAHAYQSNLLYVMFCFAASFSSLALLWGGSMAIRKKDFDELGVEKRWNETVVDDFSLSQIAMKAKKRTVLVSTCVTETDDSLNTFKQAIVWFKRQVMYLKAYHRKTWTFLAMPGASILLFMQIWLPVSIIIAGFSNVSFFSIGGAGAALFAAGTLIAILAYPSLGRSPKFAASVVFQPLSLFSLLYASVNTIFTNTVVWSGVRYKMSSGGKVASVERPKEHK
jgi:ceramide glucosyltransferase